MFVSPSVGPSFKTLGSQDYFTCQSQSRQQFCLLGLIVKDLWFTAVRLWFSLPSNCTIPDNTVCFFELKVFVNLTYLYLSEIKKQGLIFSVRMGHLIIYKKDLDLDRGFLSKPGFPLYAYRASVEL